MLQPVKVVVAEDNDDLRAALVLLINESTDLRCVADTGCLSAVTPLVRQNDADVVMLDMELGGESSLRKLPVMRAETPRAKFLIYSGHGNPKLIQGAMAAGASAYVQKSGDFDEFLRAIRSVANS